MPLERSPLPLEELPGAIAGYFAEGGPAKKVMLLARGLAPGLGPDALATGLYQASCHENDKIAAAARKSAEELPDPILDGALGAPLHPQVLDFYAAICRERPTKLQILLLNRAVADETYADLAKSVRLEALLEIIARNEQRLLRHPEIIKHLYLNPNTRMSTANRAVELAVRNGIVVDIKAYKEIAASLGAEPKYEDPGDQEFAEAAADAAFQEAKSVDGELEDIDAAEAQDEENETEEEMLHRKMSLLGLTLSQKIRLGMIGNGYQRALLLRDPNRMVAMAAIKSPRIKDAEVIRVSASKAVNDDVIRHIAQNRDWTKIHAVKANLVANPKCPLSTSMRFLSHMRLVELRKLARSKNIPNALRNAAKQMLMKKG